MMPAGFGAGQGSTAAPAWDEGARLAALQSYAVLDSSPERAFDDAPIGVKAATSLALILHELATNAAKYGALAAPEGRVAISGIRHDDRFALTWEERGGARVEGPPTRRGFGTVLAERGAITQLGGSIAHDWAPEGLILRLEVPLGRLAH